MATIGNSNIATQDEYFTIVGNTPVTGMASGLLVNDVDADGDPLTITGYGVPRNGVLKQNTDGTITYIPNPGFVGQDSFTYTVSDGKGNTSEATVYLNITAPTNNAPVLGDDAFTLASNQSVTGSPSLFLANDTDADGDALTVVSVGPAAVGTLTQNADGTVTYTPKAGFAGVDSFSYTVSDGHGNTRTATVTLTVVGAVNAAPLTQADTATLGSDGTVDIQVLANDSDADGDKLSVTTVTQGQHGQVSVDANGVVHYALAQAPEFECGTTGSYMDRIAQQIARDAGLVGSASVSRSDMQKALESVNAMNAMILEAITKTESGKTGEITLADVVRINGYIRDHYAEQWALLHGDDETGTYNWQTGKYDGAQETGYHLVQNDGGNQTMFGSNFVNTVADGLYHLGFEIKGNNLVNEDGTTNATLDNVAEWLTFFYKDRSTTGTGLDAITERMLSDNGLVNSTTATGQDLGRAADAMNGMNNLILAAVKATNVAADGKISSADVVLINEHLRKNSLAEWTALHGDDEAATYQWVNGQYVYVAASETGYHLAQNDGSNQTMFGSNFVNTVADGIYHLGFEIKNGRFYNEDGDANATTSDVADWLNYFYVDHSTTGTGLDTLVDAMAKDTGLSTNTKAAQLTDGLAAANGMNKLIVEGLKAIGAAKDGYISNEDVLALNQWVRANKLKEWTDLHGDDGTTETGFHKLQNDGGTAKLYGDALVNTVADGLYHLGFEVKDGTFRNEDGNANATVGDVAKWLNHFFVGESALPVYDKQAVVTAPVHVDGYGRMNEAARGSTGSYMDRIADAVAEDAGLLNSGTLTGSQLKTALDAINAMNAIILEAIEQSGSGKTGEITLADVVRINGYIRDHYAEQWALLHGDDETGTYNWQTGKYDGAQETGYHLVQNDGGNQTMFGSNFVNTVADGLFHLGFEIKGNNLVNEDGTTNATLDDVAEWLTFFYKDRSTTGTGLDAITERMLSDNGLVNSTTATGQDLGRAADAMNGMNNLILAAVKATNVAADGKISSADVVLINEHLRKNNLAEWTTLHGDDKAASTQWVDGKYVTVPASETGYHLAQNDGGNQTMFGSNFVNTVADGIYHLGFEIKNGRFYNEDGDANATTSDVADWLNYFYVDHSTTGTGLDTLVDAMAKDTGLSTNTKAAQLTDGLAAANGMNKLMVEGLKAIGAAKDGYISNEDVLALNQWVRANKLKEWTDLHGDDGITETGFHKLQNNGGTAKLYGDALVNTVADGLYHLGFEVKDGTFRNEDGNANATVGDVAKWLNHFFVGQSSSAVFDNQAAADGLSDSFTYTVTDGQGHDSTGTVTVNLANPMVDTGGVVLQSTTASDNLRGGMTSDAFVWHLADAAVAGPADIDMVLNMSLAQTSQGGDVLDLRDLLVGEQAGAGNSVGNLANFLALDTTSYAGKTVIHVSSMGQFKDGVYAASAEDQIIVLDNVDARAALGLAGTTSNSQLIEELLKHGNLVVGGA